MKQKLFVVWAVCAVLAACSPSQQQQAQSQVNDALIAAQVRAKLTAIDAATVSNVHVSVSNRRVALSGDVPTVQERQRIVAACRGIDGVTKVSDGLRVNAKAPTAKELEDDLALQARIKTALAEQTGVNALQVQVSVHKAVVELDGEVHSATVHALVLETVHTVPGIRQVVDRLRISHS